MEMNFSSKEELYNRLKPALSAKKEELKRNDFEYVRIEDIWNYLVERKWKNSSNLSLYKMTSDIFDVNDQVIDQYIREKMNNKNRDVYFEN